jgi:hypothetical protein
MQPGYPPPGQDPYGQPQQPQYGQPQQPQYGQPQYGQPGYDQPSYGEQPQYGQPQYSDPYAQPTSGGAYPSSGAGYPTSGGAYPQYQQPGYQQPGYPQPGYPQPGYQVPGYNTGATQNNALGIIALVLGILSIPLGCCGFFGLLLPIPAIICGAIGVKKADQGLANNKGMAVGGLICGIVGLLMGAVVSALSLVGTFDPSNYLN